MRRATVKIECEFSPDQGITARTSYARDELGRVFAESNTVRGEEVEGDPVHNRERAMVHNWLLVQRLTANGARVESIGDGLGDWNLVYED